MASSVLEEPKPRNVNVNDITVDVSRAVESFLLIS